MEIAFKRIGQRGVILTSILILSTVGMILGKLLYDNIFSSKPDPNVKLTAIQQTEQINDDRRNAITRAIEKVAPAIVGINVEEVREIRDPFFDDPFFRHFFGEEFSRKQLVRGLGSGFIISEDGYILTNDHVAGNATKISVSLTTGERFDAELVGTDPVSDIALLKINKKGLPYVKFGNSDELIIGEWVIALGNPFGLFEINDKPTVTVGVVSATNMKVSADNRRVYKDMVQTDASINSGNSGGPLINANGEVIGINTIIFTGSSYSTGSIGVGFAISINRVKKIMEELKKYGKIDRNFNPGFRIQGVDDQIAKYYNLKEKKGVIVTQVYKGGSADKAGLKPEDIIIEVNGEPIREERDLIFAVNDSKKGDVLILTVIRNGDERKINLELQ